MAQLPISVSTDGHPNNESFAEQLLIDDHFNKPNQLLSRPSGLSSGTFGINNFLADTGQPWFTFLWDNTEYPAGGGVGRYLTVGTVEIRSQQLYVGPWQTAVIATSPIGQLDFTVAACNPVPDIYGMTPFRPWLLTCQRNVDSGDTNALMLLDNMLRAISISTPSFPRVEPADAPETVYSTAAHFSPAITVGQPITIFFYRQQGIHLYVNGVKRLEIAVSSDQLQGSITGPTWNIGRWRGFRMTDNEIYISHFKWQAADTDVELTAREQKFFRPRPLAPGR